MNRKYVVAVHGLMIKNGTVAPYGTELTEGVEIDDAEKKVSDGFVLSRADFDKKAKADEKAVADSKLSPEEISKAADALKADQEKADSKQKAADDAKQKADEAHAALLESYKNQFGTDAPENVSDQVIAKAIKDKLALPATE